MSCYQWKIIKFTNYSEDKMELSMVYKSRRTFWLIYLSDFYLFIFYFLWFSYLHSVGCPWSTTKFGNEHFYVDAAWESEIYIRWYRLQQDWRWLWGFQKAAKFLRFSSAQLLTQPAVELLGSMSNWKAALTFSFFYFIKSFHRMCKFGLLFCVVLVAVFSFTNQSCLLHHSLICIFVQFLSIVSLTLANAIFSLLNCLASCRLTKTELLGASSHCIQL